MEMPNRRFPTPPPFMFHPELQPELAQRNLKNFVPFEIPSKKPKNRPNKPQLGAQAVEVGSEKRFAMPEGVGPRTLRRAPALYEFKREGFLEREDALKEDVRGRVLHHFFNKKDTTSTIIGQFKEE